MNEVILSGSLFAAMPIALLAGLVTFFSPCILPVIPGYLGYVSGTAAPRSRVTLGALLFVLGFTLVFVLLTLVSGFAGSIISYRSVINQVFGIIMVLLGFVMMGMGSFMQKTIKPNWRPKVGLAGAPFLGIAFALGWTPCIGPTLGTVMMLSTQEGATGNAVLLGICFSLGLGIPFMLAAAGFGWMTRSVGFVKRHIRTFNIIGGSLLIIVGLIMATNNWDWMSAKFLEVVNEWIPYEPTI
jgi:cytochrome c-type biogenesis protein